MSGNSPDISVLERHVESINTAYTRLGHRLGWRFLAGPRRTFTSRAPFALITLNPGGAREDPDHPRTILTIDRVTFKNLHGIISDRLAEVLAHRRFPTGWGRSTAEALRFQMSERGETVTLARLPHLSRFRLMSKEACRQPVQDFLDYIYAPGHQAAVRHHSHARRRQGARLRSAPRAPREADASPPRRIDSVSHRRLGMSLQLAGIEGADLYPEWEAHIEDHRARAAFRLLVDIAASLPHLVLSFKKKGVLKTCRLHDRSGRRIRLPYSFIVNRSWIKFYFRFSEARAGKDALKRDFNSFENGNSKGEWAVRLRTEEDVRLLLTHLR